MVALKFSHLGKKLLQPAPIRFMARWAKSFAQVSWPKKAKVFVKETYAHVLRKCGKIMQVVRFNGTLFRHTAPTEYPHSQEAFGKHIEQHTPDFIFNVHTQNLIGHRWRMKDLRSQRHGQKLTRKTP